MKSQKIINLLEQSDDDELKFQTKKWYIINNQNNGQYGQGDQNDSTIKFNAEITNYFLVDYSEAYILVTGDIAVVNGNNNTKVAFKNCHPFTRSVIHLNDEHVDTAENLDLTMNLYNLIEYSDNYADTTASLYQYKRQEQPKGNDTNLINVTTDNSSSFKYKSSLLKGLTTRDVAANVNPNIANAHRLWSNAKIAVPLKYISNFFRALELPLINTKLYIELNCTKHCIISKFATATTFQITKSELCAPIVTLNTNNNERLSDLLKKGFKRSVFWNEYKIKIQTETAGDTNENINPKCILLDASYQGLNRLLLMGFNNNVANRVQRKIR